MSPFAISIVAPTLIHTHGVIQDATYSSSIMIFDGNVHLKTCVRANSTKSNIFSSTANKCFWAGACNAIVPAKIVRYTRSITQTELCNAQGHIKIFCEDGNLYDYGWKSVSRSKDITRVSVMFKDTSSLI
jgi:hypothetical protein